MSTIDLSRRTALAGLFGLACCAAFAQSALPDTLTRVRQRGRLVVGSNFTFPTLIAMDATSGRPEGFLADMARALGKRWLGSESLVDFVRTTDETRLQAVADGSVDLLIDTTPASEEKAKLVDFSDETFPSGSGLLVKKGSPIHGLADIRKGVRVIYVKANEDIRLIRERAPDATYLEFENSTDAFAALKAGRGDVFTQVVTHLYRAASKDADYTVVNRFTHKPYCALLKKGDRQTQAAVNEFLAAFKASGEYDALYRKWFSKLGAVTPA